MKLSALSADKLNTLPDAEILSILYQDLRDAGASADAAILLGTAPQNADVRARAAAQAYLDGRIPYIVPSGGVKWEVGGAMVSECDYMSAILLGMGVPREAILEENEARTTKENMICSILQLNRALKLQNVRRVMIVSSAEHMRRSLALARLLLPRSVEATPCPATLPRKTIPDENTRALLLREVDLLRGLVQSRLIDEIEY
jgi:uncharacterized SAM-binding protein YcdF (DUF218 family)